MRFAALAVSLGSALTMVLGYFEARTEFLSTPASRLMEKIGAKALLPKHTAHQRARNLVDEMVIAAGVKSPSLHYLPEDHTINAFVIGGKNNSVALALSRGALDILTRDELQALIAHEISHIKHEDVFLHSQLSAVLHGYYLISTLREPKGHIASAAREQFWRDARRAPIPLIILGYFGFIMHCIGRLIQAAYCRNREHMADAGAIKLTRNPQALLSTFKKAYALEQFKYAHWQTREDYRHILFINYHANYRTHPPLEARIKRYGGRINQHEIDAIFYDIQSLRKFNRCAASQLDATNANLSLISSHQLVPILTLEKLEAQLIPPNSLPSDDALFAALIAGFLYHSGLNFYELSMKGVLSATLLNHTEQFYHGFAESSPLAQLHLYSHYLRNLSTLAPEKQQLLLSKIHKIIDIDESMTLYEWVYYSLYLHEYAPAKAQIAYQTSKDSFVRLASMVLYYSAHDGNKARSYVLNPPTEQEIARFNQQIEQWCKEVVPYGQASWQAPAESKDYWLMLQQDLHRLSALPCLARKAIGQAFAHHFIRQSQLSLAALHLRHLLQRVLN